MEGHAPAINKDDIQTQRPGGQYMLLDRGITSIKILSKTILPIKIYKEALFNVACNVTSIGVLDNIHSPLGKHRSGLKTLPNRAADLHSLFFNIIICGDFSKINI